MKNKVYIGIICCILLYISQPLFASLDLGYSFNTKAKNASTFTKINNKKMYRLLNFSDTSDFKDVDRGFIAPLIDGGYIENVIDIPSFQFVQQKEAPSTVNPSLWRHAQLVNRGGLYEVLPNKIYQVRSNEIANATFIETPNGLVLYDIESKTETFASAYKLYSKYRGNRKLLAVIISHSHYDHYSGINGIVEVGLATKEELTSGKIPIYVPQGFVDNAVSENMIFGKIIGTRSSYQYGRLIDVNEKGVVTDGVGPIGPGGAGTGGLPTTVKEITKAKEDIRIDGITFQFRLAPESEAPSEMVYYIPEWKALSMAEDVNQLQHNVYTLRGAKIRDANRWSHYINNALTEWGDSVSVIFGPHTWPAWDNNNVVKYLKNQRDIYKIIFDQTTRLANCGYRPRDIAKEIDIPDSLKNQWENRDYYGNLENNIMATYVYNLGWYNANPVELASHTDKETGKRYVETLGGEDEVIKAALSYFRKGDYAFVVQLLNNIEAYTSKNNHANCLMADAFEQLGYQEESATVRNWYLTAAKELRSDEILPQGKVSSSPDIMSSTSTQMILDMIATTIIPQESVDLGSLEFAMILNDDFYGLEVSRGVMNASKNKHLKNSIGTLTTDKLTLLMLTQGQISVEEAIKTGKVKQEGDDKLLSKFISVFDRNTPSGFNLIQPRLNN